MEISTYPRSLNDSLGTSGSISLGLLHERNSSWAAITSPIFNGMLGKEPGWTSAAKGLRMSFGLLGLTETATSMLKSGDESQAEKTPN